MPSVRIGIECGLMQLQNRTNLETLAGRRGERREHVFRGALRGRLSKGWKTSWHSALFKTPKGAFYNS